MTTVIPMEMKEELLAAVEYMKILINRFNRLDPVKVWTFGEKLIEILAHKYTGHWYPEKPIRGQAYRCIRVNRQYQDDGILDACSFSGLIYSELSLPKEMTLWIDPYEVSCRLGDDGYAYTVASFHPSITRPSTESLESLEEVSFSSSNC
ncbi:protein BTG3-like, partial [Spea bombifrons]|uniref:protein BTG3-like n=1 Tax=Spea bombifrons TaxID=233779 RepID=UPI002349AD93